MDKVACLDRETRADLFKETAARMGDMRPQIVEKDFWVCWLLKQLFTAAEFEGWLVFKGGTSLSKCFGLIHRFSEDIDLAVNFERLGFIGKLDPRQNDLSGKARQRILGDMRLECQQYIAGPFIEALRQGVTQILGPAGWELQINPENGGIVEFVFPSAFETHLEYIKPAVILELGTHAEPIPQEDCMIRPFAADHFPDLFKESQCSVRTVRAHRTFWEKATILHAEYYRPPNNSMPSRYSRHYADLAEMVGREVKDKAFTDMELLDAVCIHKSRFYRCAWARYMEAKPGSFHLVPPAERLPALRQDYRDMKVMFFYEPPDFEEALQKLKALEDEINALPRTCDKLAT